MSDGVGNFDDSELEDIMREMEALEKEGRSSWEKRGGKESDKKAPSSQLEDVVGRDLDEFSEEMDDFQDIEGEQGPQESSPSPNKAVGARTNDGVLGADRGPFNNTPSQMSFNITGDMEVQLSFHSHGHQVKMTVRGGQGLEIEMGSGAKFFFPFENEPKKAA